MGLFAVAEHELGVLGDLRDLDVLELACGTGCFSAWLARAGARVTAVDFSGEQLTTARRLQRQRGPDFHSSSRMRSDSRWRRNASTSS